MYYYFTNSLLNIYTQSFTQYLTILKTVELNYAISISLVNVSYITNEIDSPLISLNDRELGLFNSLCSLGGFFSIVFLLNHGFDH